MLLITNRLLGKLVILLVSFFIVLIKCMIYNLRHVYRRIEIRRSIISILLFLISIVIPVSANSIGYDQSHHSYRAIHNNFIIQEGIPTIKVGYFEFNQKDVVPSGNMFLGASRDIAAEAGTTTVGRWMSTAEYDAMKVGGRMLEGAGGKTSVSIGGSEAFTGAARGSVYAEFQVPTNSLIQGGQSNWFSILGPNASKSQLFMLGKQGGQILPEIQNLSPILRIK